MRTAEIRTVDHVGVDHVERGGTMKAISRDAYGSADVLELREIDKPEVGPDEALVRVHAAGVDRGVWHVMTGLPYPIRLAGYGLRAPKNPVLGADLAGVVEAVGDDVTRFQSALMELSYRWGVLPDPKKSLTELLAEGFEDEEDELA